MTQTISGEYIEKLVDDRNTTMLQTMFNDATKRKDELKDELRKLCQKVEVEILKVLHTLVDDNSEMRCLDIDEPYAFAGETKHAFTCTFDIVYEKEKHLFSDIALKIYDDHLEMDTSSCGFYSKVERPNRVKAIILAGKIWQNEQLLVECCRKNVDIDLLKERKTVWCNIDTINSAIRKVEHNITEDNFNKESSKVIKQLVKGKYLRWKDEHGNLDWYQIINVTDKNVMIAQCWLLNDDDELFATNKHRRESLDYVLRQIIIHKHYSIFDKYVKEEE